MEIDEKEGSKVHLLPCTINYNGPAPIDCYFIPEESLETKEITSNFRGRKLVGKEVKLPEERHGYILESFNKNKITINSTFQSITVWEHDIQPDTQLLLQSLNWFDIADIVSDYFDF